MRSRRASERHACPVRRIGLALSDRGGVQIDYCPSYRGVWLDHGELDKIMKGAAPSGICRPASRGHYDQA